MQVNDGFEVVDGTLVSYTGTQESIELPPGIHTIGARACAGNVRVRELSLGPEVEAVKSEAFAGCTSLERVRAVCDVLIIDESAFAHCTSLHTLTVEGSYLDVGREAFAGCMALRELDFREVGMIELRERSFAGCASLERVATRGSSINMHDQAFFGCTALASVECDDGPDDDGQYLCSETIESEAFAGCTSLERVRVDNLYSLGHGAFKGCTSLTEVLIPDDLRELGSAVFSGCTSLEQVRLPKAGSFEDASDLFRGCTSLTYVDLDGANFSQVQRMDGMFAGCTSLEELDLSDIDATSLLSTRDMFGGCTSLIFWEMSEAWPVGLEGAVPAPPANSRGSWWSKQQQAWLTAQQIASRGPLADTLTSYNQRELTVLAGAEVEDGVLLYYDGSRRTVVVPEGVTAIGDYAFRGRRNVESVLLPHTLRRIGMEAFAGCTALRNVEFASGPDDEDCALEIKTRAFAGCTALTSIELPPTMSESSGDYLFEGCTSLVSATLPAVGVFGAFEGCARLHEVTVGGVTFYAHDWDEDYLSYVVMAARTDAIDIREGVIYDFASSAKSAIYDWEADQERHGERPYGCAVLPEGYRCTRYLGRCSRIGIIPKDVHVHAIAPKAFPGIRHLVAFVCPEGVKKIGWGAFPAMKDRGFLTKGTIQRDVSPDGW